MKLGARDLSWNLKANLFSYIVTTVHSLESSLVELWRDHKPFRQEFIDTDNEGNDIRENQTMETKEGWRLCSFLPDEHLKLGAVRLDA